jgi:transposase
MTEQRSVYLHGEREWSQEKIADALQVSVGTVNNDLRVFSTTEKSERKEKRGRPRNLTDEQGREDAPVRWLADRMTYHPQHAIDSPIPLDKATDTARL